ncbi:hypothetical protein [Streptomyces sp. MNU89]|uniref:hypothetical protein n=1 Tax=Streptomyces sp. MNU89 TaxID=2560025 RepID=UPI001E402C3C|nr:hypothetical protein [Streptomyces sp. MNU89]MCC9738536.1 hypothetical protein [Streptomyces sp. MNU89]
MTDDQLSLASRHVPLDPYRARAPHLVAVVDTNVMLNSIDNDCRNEAEGWRSRLLLMSDRGDVVLYAADHVLDEVYEHLSKIAASSPVSLATLRARFEDEYLPALRFVSVSNLDEPDPQVLAITDPDDVPTGRLAKLIGPCVVFSEDKHLKRPGFAPKRWLDVARSAVEMSDGHQGQVLIFNAAALPLRGAVGLLTYSGRKASISPWMLGGAVLGAGAFFLRKPERRKEVAQFAGDVVNVVGTQLAGAVAKERRGIEKLRKVVLPAPTRPTIRQRVAISLARQTEPLLAAELHGLISRYFPGEPAVSVQEVRAVLEEGTEFVRVQRYRWQFGRDVAPRAC